jgi:RNA 3'-terminal phosphate cyclase
MQVMSGRFEGDPGTPGSITMMVQASLFPLLFAGGESTVDFRGSTDAPFSPPFDFFQDVFSPCLCRMGAKIAVECPKRGFVPIGGGHVKLNIPELAQPLKPIDLSERGDICQAEVCLYVTKPVGAAESEITEAVRQVVRSLSPEVLIKYRLATAPDECSMLWVNILVVTTSGARFHGSSAPGIVPCSGVSGGLAPLVEVFSAAARQACEPLAQQLASGAAADEHLLDQLILPASVAKGTSRFLAAKPSLHAQAAIHVAKLMVPNVRITEQVCGELCLIEVEGIGHRPRACPATVAGTSLTEDAQVRRSQREQQRRSDRNMRELLHLQDNDEGVIALRSALATLGTEVAPVLLHGYALAGRPRLIDALLKSGACHVDVRRAKDDCTALHIALYKGHSAVVEVLQENLADSSLRNK